MPKVRSGLLSYMRRIMIRCEDAALLSTKHLERATNARERFSLHLHLAGCRGCRKYYKQGLIINRSISRIRLKEVGNDTPAQTISPFEKSVMQRMITNKLNSL